MKSFFVVLFISHVVGFILSDPQQPEINDQFDTFKLEAEIPTADKETTIIVNPTSEKSDNIKLEEKVTPKESRKYAAPENVVTDNARLIDVKPNFIAMIIEILTRPIEKFIALPKVTFVLRNVGTCLVNGAMEIISYYLPAPLIPLIASAAGMVIPFEPVVMLKEKMPVTSYRRAFSKAMNSFLNTFDGYKLDNYEDDPYMTRRFNRRFMNDISGEKKKTHNYIA